MCLTRNWYAILPAASLFTGLEQSKDLSTEMLLKYPVIVNWLFILCLVSKKTLSSSFDIWFHIWEKKKRLCIINLFYFLVSHCTHADWDPLPGWLNDRTALCLTVLGPMSHEERWLYYSLFSSMVGVGVRANCVTRNCRMSLPFWRTSLCCHSDKAVLQVLPSPLLPFLFRASPSLFTLPVKFRLSTPTFILPCEFHSFVGRWHKVVSQFGQPGANRCCRPPRMCEVFR